MGDVGATILVQRKFAIHSQFLDTVLQSEGMIEEGETRQVALLRVHRELEETAVHLRRNAEHPVYGKYPLTPDECTPEKPSIIDKSIERLEIAIDNCQSLEELDQLKKDNPVMTHKLMVQWNTRKEILRVEANNKAMGEKNS